MGQRVSKACRRATGKPSIFPERVRQAAFRLIPAAMAEVRT